MPDIKPCSGSLKKGQRFFAGDQGETYAGRCFSQRPLLLILREPVSANAVPGPASVEDIMLYTKKDSAEENSDLRQNSLL
ncbi:MAG: hypothetical protein VB108_00380 [Anaerolineaceae bacterium]|nr:hypothetical protein [Anaerolineaceae bacterium]